MLLRPLMLSIFAARIVVTPLNGSAESCTTKWNAVSQQDEARCDDGGRTTTTETYKPILRQNETDIRRPLRPGFPPTLPTHCVTNYNVRLQQYERECQ